MTDSAIQLQLEGVTKHYDAVEDAEPAQVLRGIDLEVKAGESLAVVGPSGSGKSTLLYIMGTLDRPTTGNVWFDGRDGSGMNDEELAQLRNREIGFIFQFHHLLPQCTALENVLVPTLVHTNASDGGELERRAIQLLEKVGLGHRLHHRPAQLSGGERQRVAVVRALMNQPRLVLADEPTGSLDGASARELAELLVMLNQEWNVTLVVVTHSEDLAGRMDRVLHLQEGRLSASGARP